MADSIVVWIRIESEHRAVVCIVAIDLQTGEVGFADEDVMESRRSKLVPYGLLSSSSFHILALLDTRNDARESYGYDKLRRRITTW